MMFSSNNEINVSILEYKTDISSVKHSITTRRPIARPEIDRPKKQVPKYWQSYWISLALYKGPISNLYSDHLTYLVMA